MKEVGLHLPVYQAQFYLGVSLVLYIPTAVSPEQCDRDVNELVISQALILRRQGGNRAMV